MSEPVQTFASVWDALEESSAEAAHMRLRSELTIAIRTVVEQRPEAAQKLNLPEPRLAALLRGHLEAFTLDALVELADRAGLAIRMEISRAA
jgi:predicted XRE-type DNA-binding protein